MTTKYGDLERDAEVLLRTRQLSATDLLVAIHAVNPTGLELRADVQRKRYALKSRLQSRLIIDFVDELQFDPVEGELGVIGLRYRPMDRDACHAVLSELSEEARSLAQFQLDTSEGPGRLPGADGRATPAPSGAPASQHLAEGRQALLDYDYEKARNCFEGALAESEESDAPALALLELFVDHLAAWPDALAVEAQLTSRQLTSPVRTLLAVAAAHAGDAEACRRLANGAQSPRLAVALCTLASQALQRADLVAARGLLVEAKCFDATAPEFLAIEGELARLKAAQRAPAEQELEALFSTGEASEAAKKAALLLERWPESPVARRVLRDAEAQLRTRRLASLTQRAGLAADAGDDASALALWGEAVQLGAVDLAQKLAGAAARLEDRAREERVNAVAALSGQTLDARVLSRYLSLTPGERHQVRQRTSEVSLEWLELLGASSSERDWPLDIAAVLALRSASSAAPGARLPLLRPHEARVRQLEPGRALLDEAQAQLRAASLEDARVQLERARTAQAEGRWRDAIQLAQTAGALGEEASGVAARARRQLEAIARRERFDRLLADSQELEAQDVLREADAHEAEDPSAWALRREELSTRLRKKFEVELSTSPADLRSDDVAAGTRLLELSYALDEAGEYAYWVTGLGRRLFVRRIDLREQRVVQLVALTTPEPLDFADAQVDRESLWLSSAEGVALQLCTKTWAVLRWHSVQVAETQAVDGALVTPGGRFHWLCLRPRAGHEETLRIIDLERGRVHRELAKDGLGLKLLTSSTGPRVYVAGFERRGRLFAAGGGGESMVPAGVEQLMIAPSGSGLIAVARPDEGEGDDEAEDLGGLRVLQLSDDDAAPVFVEELEDSFNDGALVVATSLAANASFVLYSGQEGSYWLAAYTSEARALRRRWRVQCPARCQVLQDLQARRVYLLAPFEGGLRCVPLTGEAPDLGALLSQRGEARLPKLIDEALVCHPWWDSALVDLSHVVHRATTEAARHKLVSAFLEQYGDKPAALAYFAKDLRNWKLVAAAGEVMKVAASRFAAHPATRLDVAEVHFEKGQWQACLEALERIAEGELGLRPLQHWQHLQGLAHYHLGRLGAAREAFSQMKAQHGTGCQVEGWPEWLDALMGRPSETSAARLLAIVREADEAIAAGQCERALALLDVPLVWGTFEVQLGARLASAALGGGGAVRARLIVASFLSQVDSRRTVTLPLGPLAWSAARLVEVAERARHWLSRA